MSLHEGNTKHGLHELKGRTQTSLSEINITPFVDVVLVLLIIFMLTAPILESGIVMQTPKTKTVRECSSREDWSSPSIEDKNYYVGNDMVNIHLLGADRPESAQGRPQPTCVYPV